MPNIFSPEALRDQVHANIDAAFKAIPDGRRGVLLVVADEKGARGMVAAKIGDHWQLEAGGGKDWKGPVYGNVSVAGSW